jgi:hypothetical protein
MGDVRFKFASAGDKFFEMSWGGSCKQADVRMPGLIVVTPRMMGGWANKVE